MSRKLKPLSVKQRYRPKPKRPSKYPSHRTTVTFTNNTTSMPHRPSRGAISRVALLAAYSRAGPSSRTDQFARPASHLAADCVRPSSVTSLNTSKPVFKPRKPVYLVTFNVRSLKHEDSSYDVLNALLQRAKSSNIVEVAVDMNAHLVRIRAAEARLGDHPGLDTKGTDNGEAYFICVRKTRTPHLAIEKLVDPEVKRNYQNQLLECLPDAPRSGEWNSPVHYAFCFDCDSPAGCRRFRSLSVRVYTLFQHQGAIDSRRKVYMISSDNDDIVLIFEAEKAQVFLDELTKVIPSFGMHFAPTKCKVMLVHMRSLNAPLTIQGELKDVITFEMLVQAVKEDDFVFLDDNLTAYITKRHECVGESKSEERLLEAHWFQLLQFRSSDSGRAWENALNWNARQCMTTLFNPPYNVKYRCFRDLFQAFAEDDIWKVDRVLPQIPKRFNNLRYHDDDCSLSTLLLRPLDVLWGLENSSLVQEITRPKRRTERSPPMVELCNMFFEVMFSTPALSSKLDALKHENIKSWYLLATEEIKWLTHLSECIGFPQCLLQPDCVQFVDLVTERTDLSSVFRLWTAHRFKSVGTFTSSASIDPPSLLVCCRVRIRIHLITLQAVTSKRTTQSRDSEPHGQSRNLTTTSGLMAPKEENYEKQKTTESTNQGDKSTPQSKEKTTESQQNNHTQNCRIEYAQRTNQTQEIETNSDSQGVSNENESVRFHLMDLLTGSTRLLVSRQRSQHASDHASSRCSVFSAPVMTSNPSLPQASTRLQERTVPTQSAWRLRSTTATVDLYVNRSATSHPSPPRNWNNRLASRMKCPYCRSSGEEPYLPNSPT
ncbi:hypothetical protein CLF_109940, partial [Clonorchis sinensis]